MDQSALECLICREKLEAGKPSFMPKVLPCGHTFCDGCIDRSFQCPVCKEAFPAPSSAAQLKTSFAKMNILTKMSSREKKPTASVSCFFSKS